MSQEWERAAGIALQMNEVSGCYLYIRSYQLKKLFSFISLQVSFALSQLEALYSNHPFSYKIISVYFILPTSWLLWEIEYE